MALNARDFTLPGQWAKDANTTIPPIPVSGQAYRNAALAKAIIENGQNYDNIADSAVWNQLMYLASGMALESEQYGIPRWSPLTDYTGGASLAIGTDGTPYRAVLDSGPSGAGPQDPTTTTGYWQSLGEFIGGVDAATQAEVNAGTIHDKFVAPDTLKGVTGRVSQFPNTSGQITVSVTSQSSMSYTAPNDGWVAAVVNSTPGNGLYLFIQGSNLGVGVEGAYTESIPLFIPVAKGSVVGIRATDYPGSVITQVFFIPAKKGIPAS